MIPSRAKEKGGIRGMEYFPDLTLVFFYKGLYHVLSFFDFYLDSYILFTSNLKYQLSFSSMMQTFSQKV